MNNYTITVVFTRQHSDDDDMVMHRFNELSDKTLTKQLVDELQEACDTGIIGGSFKVTSIDSHLTDDDSNSARETD